MQENNFTYTRILSLGIWNSTLPNLHTQDLISKLYNLKNLLPSAHKSNVGGYQSPTNLHLNPDFFS
jgi:hypothetical protein